MALRIKKTAMVTGLFGNCCGSSSTVC